MSHPRISNSAFSRTLLALACLAALTGVGCADRAPAPPTKALQQSATPDSVLARLMAGNERFVEGRPLRRDVHEAISESSKGQYPYAVLLTCLDSRTGPELVFDQGVGDIFVARVAGNYATPDILGSMEFATKAAGAKLVMVVGHSSCGAVKGAADNVQMGNLTTVISGIRPAVADVPPSAGKPDSHNAAFVQALAEANVRRTVAKIRSDSPLLAQLEKDGQIKIVGAMQDLKTGRVSLLQ